MVNIPGLENIDWLSLTSKLVYWLSYILLAVLIIGAILLIIYLTSFKYKMRVWPMYGSGRDGQFSVGKAKSNRAKLNKKSNEWQLLFPLFKKKTVEPFDSEYIYPGHQCYAFELNNMLMPGRININQDETGIRAEVNPVPTYVRYWQDLKHKEHAIEFNKTDWWQENKAFVYMLVAVFICCVLCGVTIYFTYQFAGGGAQELSKLSNAINNLGVTG